MKASRYRYLGSGNRHGHAADEDGATLCGEQSIVVLRSGCDTPIVLRDHWVLGDDFCPVCLELLVFKTGWGLRPSQWTNWPHAWLIIKRQKP